MLIILCKTDASFDHFFFTFIFQYSTDKITNSFIANANLALLLITGHYKKTWREVNWTLGIYFW